MKNRFMRYLAITMLLVTLAVSIQPANAANPGTYYAHRGSPSSGIVCEVTTTVTTRMIKPYYQSQTEHRRGISTTIGISKGFSRSHSVSKSLSGTIEAQYLGIALSATATAGVSDPVTYTETVSHSWTISADTADSMYRVEVVFPQFNAHIRTYLYTLQSTTTVTDETLILADTTECFVRLNRYADCD